MSTAQLQTAMIQLIRLPKHNRGKDLNQFLGQYDLTESERWQLGALAQDHYLAKFGRGQREQQIDFNIKRPLKNSIPAIGPRRITDAIIFEEFEPENTHVKEEDLLKTFVRWFLSHSDRLTKAHALKPEVFDLIRYEYQEFAMNADAQYDIPPGENLFQPDVRVAVQDFNYDILAYRYALDQIDKMDFEKIARVRAKPKKHSILFLRVPKKEVYLAEQFEIDQELRSFITNQLAGLKNVSLPPCYEDLVEMGVCRPRSN